MESPPELFVYWILYTQWPFRSSIDEQAGQGPEMLNRGFQNPESTARKNKLTRERVLFIKPHLPNKILI